MNSLWTNCIKAWHNVSCIDGKPLAKASLQGVWLVISKLTEDMEHWGINLEDLFVRRLGARNRTYFWKDKWCDSVVLKDVFPELYRIEMQKNCMVSNRIQNKGLDGIHGQWSGNLRRGREATSLSYLNKKVVGMVLTCIDDSWVWKGNETGGFTVQNLRNLMATAEEVSNTFPFHWEGWAPLKVNCFVWCLCLNRILLEV